VARLLLAAVVWTVTAPVGSVLATVSSPGTAGLLPVAVNDTGSVAHGRLRTVGAPGILGNDLQLGGGFEADLVTDVSHGDLDLDPDGSYTYRSDADFLGVDQFRYRIDGGLLGLSNTATVRITVTNAAPVARPDAYTAIADVERSFPAPGVLANDDDADGDRLTVDIVSEPAHGNLNERDDGSFRYKADDDFAGTDTFRYRAWDGFGWSATVTVTITVGAAATPVPTPTPKPTPKPTANPTSTPSPTAVATPRPTTAPTARPTARPTPTATPRPGSGPTPRPSVSVRPTSTPRSSPAPAVSAAPTVAPSAQPVATSPAASSGPSPHPTEAAAGAGGTGGTGGTDDGGAGGGPGIGLPGTRDPGAVDIDLRSVAFDGFEWAVPSLVMTVPGLLLVLALLAQGTIGTLLVPVARRILGADRRRRRDRAGRSPA
jgi:hypothetical protein